jgi:pimeloyl-ACP methyl ester carboxylesterase
MPAITANGLTFEYDVSGADTSPPVLLVMGLGMQLVAWPDAFVAQLVAAGFRVIRFDNRDIGLSSKFDHVGTPNLLIESAKFMMGLGVKSAYNIDDMARDTAALMDALKIERAHIVGASMGGMIAQNLASRFPPKVQSLTSLMSSTGRRSLPQPTWKARSAMLARRPKHGDIEAAIERMKFVFRTIGSPGFPEDEATLHAFCKRHVTRSYNPAGTARQLMAVAASGDRTQLLRLIVAPTLVIHGKDDPLLPVAHGIETAREIPGAKLSIVSGMGHDLPMSLVPRLVEEIAAHCHDAGNTMVVNAAGEVRAAD